MWVVSAAVVAWPLASAIVAVMLAALPMPRLISLQVIKQTHFHVTWKIITSIVRVMTIPIAVFAIVGFAVSSKSGFNDLIQPHKPFGYLTLCCKGWRVLGFLLLQQFPLNACRQPLYVSFKHFFFSNVVDFGTDSFKTVSVAGHSTSLP